MAEFQVNNIIDGDTFEVYPEWRWHEQSGSRVRPTGYYAPELHEIGGQKAKEKLSRLISGKKVDLKSAYRIDRGRIVCDVYLNGKNLAGYFPEYQ
jgi:endonuclease YncB( thermonuclease family)